MPRAVRRQAAAACAALVLLTMLGAAAGHHPAPAGAVYPLSLEARWCANAPAQDGCVATAANGTANWTVLLTMTWAANETPTAFTVLANQSIGTPFLGSADNLSRSQEFPVNATGSVVMGTDLKRGFGLNPTQSWIFGVCSGSCLFVANFTEVTATLSPLFPNGTIAGASAEWLSWIGQHHVRVGWTYTQAALTANFFRVGLLTGLICLRPPSLAQWNATTWRRNTTPNDSFPSPDRTYTFGGLNSSKPGLNYVCAYVEAVNTSIGDGIRTLYPHGFPRAEAFWERLPLVCPRCRSALRLGLT